MFTGLVEAIGGVRALEERGDGSRLILETSIARELSLGESLAVNGCCLTVTSTGDGVASFDLLGETIARTNISTLNAGSRVNLERALRADGRFGGHFVQGHVDGVGVVESVRTLADSAVIGFKAPEEVLRYIVEKG